MVILLSEGKGPLKPELVSSTVVYKGWLSLRVDKLRLPRTGITTDYAVIDADDSVIILPFTNDNHVILVDEYRHPVRGNKLSLPSGRIDLGESPVEAAIRELRQETGYQAGSMEELCSGYIWQGVSNMRIFCYIAEGLIPRSQEQDADEDIKVVIIPYEKLLAQALSNTETNIQLIWPLLTYELKKRA